MGLGPAALAAAKEALERVEAEKAAGDRRAEVCACGHTMAKHEQNSGLVWVCIQGGYDKCRCRQPRAVLKVPNARLFTFRNDDTGAALFKGIGKTVEAGLVHRLDWVGGCEVGGGGGCSGEPIAVVIRLLGDPAKDQRSYQPRCEVHQ